MGSEEQRSVINEHREFTINQFRLVIRPIVSVIWLLFLCLDFYYLPRALFPLCLGLRGGVALLWCLTPTLFRIRWFGENYQTVSLLCICACGLAMNVMIASDDSYPSVYLLGLILSHQMGVVLLKVKTHTNLIASFVNYGFAILMTFLQWDANLKIQVTISIILVGFVAFNYLYSSRETTYFEAQVALRALEVNKQKIIEVEKNRQIEEERILHTFPPFLVDRVRSDQSRYSRFEIKDAVVGIVDIESSSQISNSVATKTSWDLKNLFTDIFIEEAKKRGIVPLSWTGDGFMFIANFFGEIDWQFRLAALIEVMHEEFERIVGAARITVPTGLKFGIARGEVIVGHLGKQKAFYNADGATINLASRLCSEVSRNQCCMTGDVWNELRTVMVIPVVDERNDFIPKGWTHPLHTIIVTRSGLSDHRPLCSRCSSPMLVTVDAKGFTDLCCPRCD